MCVNLCGACHQWSAGWGLRGGCLHLQGQDCAHMSAVWHGTIREQAGNCNMVVRACRGRRDCRSDRPGMDVRTCRGTTIKSLGVKHQHLLMAAGSCTLQEGELCGDHADQIGA